MWMIGPFDLALITGAALGSWLCCLILIKFLSSRGVLDIPVERSSHTMPTPRGGGIAVVAIILGIAAFFSFVPMTILVVFGILAVIGWADDVYTLSPIPRFLAQIVVVVVTLYVMQDLTNIPGLEFNDGVLDEKIVFICWLWFINLYNFMDGVDGITGIETISISVGVISVASLTGSADELILPASIIGAATLGFLIVNWHPAKIFLGDVGSIPLGFILGWLLLELAHAGYLVSAIIIPMYYLADATVTLLKRVWRRAKPWQAHKEHFYQRAHQGGLSHDAISIRILGVNIGLIILAVIAAKGYPEYAFMGAVLLTTGLLFHFNQHGKLAS